jgi:hypothetical protein
MKLDEYPQNVIESAIKAKNLNHVKLAFKLGRSASAVNAELRHQSRIKSEKLQDSIVAALQPELDLIYTTFLQHNILNSTFVSPESKQDIAGTVG